MTVRAQASAGAVTLSDLAGNVTATAKVGIIYATGLSGSAVAHVGHAEVGVRQSSSSGHVITATTDVGSINVSAST